MPAKLYIKTYATLESDVHCVWPCMREITTLLSPRLDQARLANTLLPNHNKLWNGKAEAVHLPGTRHRTLVQRLSYPFDTLRNISAHTAFPSSLAFTSQIKLSKCFFLQAGTQVYERVTMQIITCKLDNRPRISTSVCHARVRLNAKSCSPPHHRPRFRDRCSKESAGASTLLPLLCDLLLWTVQAENKTKGEKHHTLPAASVQARLCHGRLCGTKDGFVT